MIKITLKDGSIKEFEKGITIGEVVASIGSGLLKAALAAKVDGKVCELNKRLNENAALEVLTFEDDDGRLSLRHTSSHVLAQAVKRLYPQVKLAIGPAIENGFYYDFDSDKAFTEAELELIEKEMANIVKEDYKLERFELARAEAIKLMEEKGEKYKVELINDLQEDEIISFYKQGEFIDLCAGPHIPSTGKIKAFKLLSVAGAYWRGNEKNKMLQRIYGTSFAKKSQLDEYIKMLEEAKKRDHRKLGKELELFELMDEGPGFPFFLPKGVELKNQLLKYWREIHKKAGYVEVETPIILNRQLWETSGHWFNYKENMYTVQIDEEDYAIKPMNCPGGLLVYNSKLHSYRDFPMRVAELGRVHRHELSGALHGLMRVRAFTQDDAHIFMLPEQIKDEIKGVAKLIDEVYKTFGFSYHVELSTRPEKFIGEIEVWDQAEEALKGALEELELPYKLNEGDGAFYGPKIDFHLRDCIGRTWQCGTIQLDYQLPLRFDITYIAKDGQKHRPVMIHRVLFGSIERFIAILTEHFAGAFPVWIAPAQVVVIPVSERQYGYAKEIEQKLNDADVRVDSDLRSEKVGYKIREAQLNKVPYMLIVGDKEIESSNVSVRDRKEGDLGSMKLDEFMDKIKVEITEKINK